MLIKKPKKVLMNLLCLKLGVSPPQFPPAYITFTHVYLPHRHLKRLTFAPLPCQQTRMLLLLWWQMAKGRNASETSVFLSWVMRGMSSGWFIIYIWSGSSFYPFGRFVPLMVISSETPAASRHKGTFSLLSIWNKPPLCSEMFLWTVWLLQHRYWYETEKNLNW